jgi:hypothetical protein
MRGAAQHALSLLSVAVAVGASDDTDVDAVLDFYQMQLRDVVHFLYEPCPGDEGPSRSLSRLDRRVVVVRARHVLRVLLSVASVARVRSRLVSLPSVLYCCALLHRCPLGLCALFYRLLRTVLLSVPAQTAGVCLLAAAQFMSRIATGEAKIAKVLKEVRIGVDPASPTKDVDQCRVVEHIFSSLMKVGRLAIPLDALHHVCPSC